VSRRHSKYATYPRFRIVKGLRQVGRLVGYGLREQGKIGELMEKHHAKEEFGAENLKSVRFLIQPYA